MPQNYSANMDTRGQFSFFLFSIAIGAIGGVLYEPFHFIRLLFACDRGKCKALAVVLDVLFWLTFALGSVIMEFAFRFQGVRVYTWGGYLVGGILYLIFLHRIVAFLEKVCYNKIVKIAKKAKKRDKTVTKRGKRRV